MKEIKLIYFKGCPNYRWIKKLILESGISFEEIDQNSLSENHPFRDYTSPSVIKNRNLIAGAKIDNAMGSCSISLPSKSELKEKLKE